MSIGSTQTNESDSGKEETIERLKPPDYPKVVLIFFPLITDKKYVRFFALVL